VKAGAGQLRENERIGRGIWGVDQQCRGELFPRTSDQMRHLRTHRLKCNPTLSDWRIKRCSRVEWYVATSETFQRLKKTAFESAQAMRLEGLSSAFYLVNRFGLAVGLPHAFVTLGTKRSGTTLFGGDTIEPTNVSGAHMADAAITAPMRSPHPPARSRASTSVETMRVLTPVVRKPESGETGYTEGAVAVSSTNQKSRDLRLDKKQRGIMLLKSCSAFRFTPASSV